MCSTHNFILAASLLALSACVAQRTVPQTYYKTPFHPDAPSQGVSDTGVDYGNWSDPFSEFAEQEAEDQRFSESIKKLNKDIGNVELVIRLRSDGFDCQELLDSFAPTIWHCKNVIVEDIPMGHRIYWQWGVTLWEEKVSAGHFSEAILY